MALDNNFSNEKNLSRIKAGLKGGQYFENPIPRPSLSFVDGHPAEHKQIMGSSESPKMAISAPFFGRGK